MVSKKHYSDEDWGTYSFDVQPFLLYPQHTRWQWCWWFFQCIKSVTNIFCLQHPSSTSMSPFLTKTNLFLLYKILNNQFPIFWPFIIKNMISFSIFDDCFNYFVFKSSFAWSIFKTKKIKLIIHGHIGRHIRLQLTHMRCCQYMHRDSFERDMNRNILLSFLHDRK